VSLDVGGVRGVELVEAGWCGLERVDSAQVGPHTEFDIVGMQFETEMIAFADFVLVSPEPQLLDIEGKCKLEAADLVE